MQPFTVFYHTTPYHNNYQTSPGIVLRSRDMHLPTGPTSKLTKLSVVLLAVSSYRHCCDAMDPWPTITSSPQCSHAANCGVTNMDSTERTSSSKSRTISSCTCKFFVWDFWSYFKYRETTHQLNRNTYEGLGGRKFVRAQPGSILEKWYPQLRRGELKKDGCLLCGYSFTDHLEFWSRKKQTLGQGRVSCYDRYLDSTFSHGEGHTKGSLAGTGRSFYQKYVEVSSNNDQRSKRRGKELRRVSDGNVSYLVPPFNPSADGTPKKPWTVLILAMARTAALERVDDLIRFEKIIPIRREYEQ